ncbi:hypothetical protein [Ferroacidibacillus organovorans]|nr:hypothetical protein [Ferroacidibacillus organovorans]
MPRNVGLEPGQRIPDFTLSDLAGVVHRHTEYLGKPLLLYFLRGTW